jgi:putative tricarboxylic transport membrane protein
LKLNDALVGALLLALSIAILVYVRTLPNIPGQNIGPAAFPGLLAAILLGCSVALMARGWRARGAGPWAARMEWTRHFDQVRNFALVCGALFFYSYFSETLGYFICAFVVLGSLLASLRVRPALVVPLSLGITLFIHTLFYKLLRVPLPWGLLERFAW